MPKKITFSYYPWITQSISGPELAAAIGAFANLLLPELRKAIDNTVELDTPKVMEIPDQLAELQVAPSGDVIAKIGLLNPIGYALVHKAEKGVKAVAVIRRKIGTDPAGPTYKAQIYTHRKTGIKEMKHVGGRSMAFGSPQSTSNFLIPAVMLFDAKIHPLNGLSRVEFTGGHDKAAAAVYEGRLEVGAGHDGAIIDLSHRAGYGDADQVMVPLKWSKPIPSDPVAVHASDPALHDQIGAALKAVADPDPDPKMRQSPGNQAVKKFWATDEGFETIAADAPDDYARLLGLMDQLNLRRDDMLRKL